MTVIPGQPIIQRQPEVADETGNTYITEIITARVEISTTKLWFTTMERRNKVSAIDCDSDRQPEIAIWPPKPETFISCLLYTSPSPRD